MTGKTGLGWFCFVLVPWVLHSRLWYQQLELAPLTLRPQTNQRTRFFDAQGEDGATRQLLECVRKRDNEFGYAAVAVEWDIWLSPKKPWDLARARIVSGEEAGRWKVDDCCQVV